MSKLRKVIAVVVVVILMAIVISLAFLAGSSDSERDKGNGAKAQTTSLVRWIGGDKKHQKVYHVKLGGAENAGYNEKKAIENDKSYLKITALNDMLNDSIDNVWDVMNLYAKNINSVNADRAGAEDSFSKLLILALNEAPSVDENGNITKSYDVNFDYELVDLNSLLCKVAKITDVYQMVYGFDAKELDITFNGGFMKVKYNATKENVPSKLGTLQEAILLSGSTIYKDCTEDHVIVEQANSIGDGVCVVDEMVKMMNGKAKGKTMCRIATLDGKRIGWVEAKSLITNNYTIRKSIPSTFFMI